MIGLQDCHLPEGMSLQEMRFKVLPHLFSIIAAEPEDLSIFIWPNETLEIIAPRCRLHSSQTVYLTREGRVFTNETKNFEHPAAETKRTARWCGDCSKNCGCGCLTDLGFYPQERDSENHCEDKIPLLQSLGL